ncbi:hybrid signal transduction histidine kinase M [Hydra vulgaris]|uniref:Hybrid signal transduction histidine kinase M n=1 Tax=Hydra vulgaris TaxID=6087 RepID=A0ABM4DEN8_HYDVU
MKYPVEYELIKATHKSECSTESLFDLLQQKENVFLYDYFEDKNKSGISEVYPFKNENKDFEENSFAMNSSNIVISSNIVTSSNICLTNNLTIAYKDKKNTINNNNININNRNNNNNSNNNNNNDHNNNYNKSIINSNNNSNNNINGNQNNTINNKKYNNNDNTNTVRKIFSQYSWFTEDNYPTSNSLSSLTISKKKSSLGGGLDPLSIKKKFPFLLYNQNSSSSDLHSTQLSRSYFLQTMNACKKEAVKKKTLVIEKKILEIQLEEVNKIGTSLFFLNNFQPAPESKPNEFEVKNLANNVAPLPSVFSKETSCKNIQKQKLTVFENTETDLWFKNQYLVPTSTPVISLDVSQQSKDTDYTLSNSQSTSLTDLKKTIDNVDNFLRLRNIQSYKKNMLSNCKFSKKSSQLFKWKLESVKDLLPIIIEEVTNINSAILNITNVDVTLNDDVKFDNKFIEKQIDEKIEYIILENLSLVPLSILLFSDCSEKVEIKKWTRKSITINQDLKVNQSQQIMTMKTVHFKEMSTQELRNSYQEIKNSFYENFNTKKKATENDVRARQISSESNELRTTELKTFPKTITKNSENYLKNYSIKSKYPLLFDSANIQDINDYHGYYYNGLNDDTCGSDFYENRYLEEYSNFLNEKQKNNICERKKNDLDLNQKFLNNLSINQSDFSAQKETENNTPSLPQWSSHIQTKIYNSKIGEEKKTDMFKTKADIIIKTNDSHENNLCENFNHLFVDSFQSKASKKIIQHSEKFHEDNELPKYENLYLKNQYKSILAQNKSVSEDMGSKKFDVANAVDENGNSCLHIAAINCDISAIKYILRNGGNVFQKNNNNLLPIDMAGDFKTASLISSVMLFYGHS